MRGAGVDRRTVPVGVNLAPPLQYWGFTGGAVYDPTTATVSLPIIGATVQSPLFRVDGSRWVLSSEQRYPRADHDTYGAIATTFYYDAAQRPHTVPGGWVSNGHGTGWRPTTQWQEFPYTASELMWDTGLIWMVLRFTNNVDYPSSGIQIRNPQLTTRT